MNIVLKIKVNFVVLIMISIGFLLLGGCSSFPEQSSTAQINQANQTLSNKQPDIKVLRGVVNLCIYKSFDWWDVEIKDANFRFHELINAGFPEEISLEEAVIIFNKIADCDERSKTQSPLTADEVLAAIRDWDCTKGENADDKKFCADTWKIAETGKMPKGSFFDFDRGMVGTSRVRGYKGYYVKTWEIFLYLHLDKHRRDLRDVPEFRRSIRLKYISSETE
jgi:hypothetical protein